MVDFQSRDTRRGPSDDDEDERAESDDDERVESDDVDEDAAATEEGTEETSTPEEGSGTETESGTETGSGTQAGDGATARSREAGAESEQVSQAPPEGNAQAGDGRTARADGARTADGTTSGEDPATGGTDDAGDEEPTPATDAADRHGTVQAAVVTISATRSHESDPGGTAIADALEAAGHATTTREILRPTYDEVQGAVDRLVDRSDVDVVVTNGGVGPGPDDVTVEAIHPLVDKALPGFGEVFRRYYAEAVGTDVVSTRATGGIANGTPVFCLPGDPDAARLGVDEVVAEQAARLVALGRGTADERESEAEGAPEA